MTTLSYTYTLTNGTVADATQVMSNFNAIVSVVNTHIDASNIDASSSITWTGTETFAAGLIKIKGSGAGVVALQNDNTASSRTVTYPDPGANYFVSPADLTANLTNLRLTLAAGVIKIQGWNGSDLATNNSGFVSYPSSTAGQWLSQQITATQSITNGGIKGRWGTTASVAWGNDMPFAVGITSSDNTAANARFFLSRNPTMITTPASTNNIGIDGTAPATSAEGNIILFGSGVATGYNSRPCRIIGSCRMTCDNTAGGVWTVTALDNGDGIGNFFNFGSRDMTMPLGQNGATSGKFGKDNGGTFPTFTAQNVYLYRVMMNGKVVLNVQLRNSAGGTAGAGAVAMLIPAPLAAITALNGYSNMLEGGGYVLGNALDALAMPHMDGTTSLTDMKMLYQATTKTASSQTTNADFSVSGRAILMFTAYSAQF